MNEERGQSLVVGCLAASAAIVAANAIAEGHAPAFRQLAGFTFAAVGLGTLAMVAPDLAGSLSMLVLTSALFLYSGPMLDAVKATTTAATSTTTTSATLSV